LLRGVQIERVASDTAAETVRRYVAQRSVLPRIRDGEDESAVPADENVLLDITWRRRGAFWFRLDGCPRGSRAPWRWRVGGGNVSCGFIVRCGVVGYGSSLFDNHWWAQEKAAEPERHSPIESATAVVAIAADRSEVRKIKP
jgi:hypothetical protein